MQDVIAIAIVAAASYWLSRQLWRRASAPPCQPPTSSPPGSDGFVPLEQLSDPRNAR